MSHFEQLRTALLEHSNSAIWETALSEWDPVSVWSEPDGTCACGYYPISERALVRNRLTGSRLQVGRICIKHFMDLPKVEKIFSAISRCQKTDSKIPELLFTDAYARSVINERSFEFLKSIHRKRKLSPKQKAWMESLRVRILQAYKRVPV